jgi:hypothetical protein
MKIHKNRIINLPITACKQYGLAAGATQGNIAYTPTVVRNAITQFAKKENNTK